MSKSKITRKMLKVFLEQKKKVGKAARYHVSGVRQEKKKALDELQKPSRSEFRDTRPRGYRHRKNMQGIYKPWAEGFIKRGKEFKKRIKDEGGL